MKLALCDYSFSKFKAVMVFCKYSVQIVTQITSMYNDSNGTLTLRAMRPMRQHQIGAVDKVDERQVRKFLAAEVEANVFDEDDGSVLSTTPDFSLVQYY